VLRPGRQVQLINVSAGGVLITSFCRLRPGARAELQLTGTYPLVVAGRIDRCRVVSLEPLNYEGAIVFERVLEWLQ
jgi:hypothetical protein